MDGFYDDEARRCCEDSRYIEVRICYQFTTLINFDEVQLPLGWGISVGEIWLEKDRVFGVGYYPPPPTPETAATATTAITDGARAVLAIATSPPSRHPAPAPSMCSSPIRSTEVDCSIETWSWDFGDGSPPSDLSSIQNIRSRTGDPTPARAHTVTLTVASAAGC